MLCTRAADNQAVVCYVPWWAARTRSSSTGSSLIIDEQARSCRRGGDVSRMASSSRTSARRRFQRRLPRPRLRKESALDEGDRDPARAPHGRGRAKPTPAASGQPVLTAAASPRGGGQARSRSPARAGRSRALQEVYDALRLGDARLRAQELFPDRRAACREASDSRLCACVAADTVGPAHFVGVAMPSPSPRPRRAGTGGTCEALGSAPRPADPGRVRAYRRAPRAPFEGPRADQPEEEPPGPHPRQLPHGAVEQVRVARPHHQQERVVGGIPTLYGDSAGWLRRAQGRVQDDGLRSRSSGTAAPRPRIPTAR